MQDIKNLTQAELDNDLKQNHAATKEGDYYANDTFMKNVMEKIEKRRETLMAVSSIYTQEYVAKKAGISLSTYKNYLDESNIGLRLRTLKNIADVLGCKPSDFLD